MSQKKIGLREVLIDLFPVKILEQNLQKALKYFSAAIAKNGKLSFMTWELWPSHKNGICFDKEYRLNASHASDRDHNNAIIIQGPIKRERDYTLETVKLYLSQNPNTYVIVSTWDTERLFEFNELENPNLYIVTSKLPDTAGSHNFNYQRISTNAGIKKANELNVKFVCKTRTDHRIYAPYFMRTLQIMLEKAVPPQLCSGGRVIENSSHICKFRPYSMSDAFQYAKIGDIQELWDVAPDLRNRTAEEYQREKDGRVRLIDYALDDIAEVGLHLRYSKKVAPSLTLSLLDYYKFIVDKFYIIDDQLIQLHMYRHDNRERFRVGDPGFEANRDLTRIDHMTWLRMTEGFFPNINFDVYKVEQP